MKNFGHDTHARGIRTLDIFFSTLSAKTGGGGVGRLPENFVVMLPKVVSAQQVTTMVELFELFESAGKFPRESLKMEFMVETTQSVIDASGKVPVADFVRASRGRCIAAALGVYDYTASCGVTAQEQKIDHRACDFARHVMQVSLGATGLYLSDGATNIMPAPPHRAAEGATLSPQQITENRTAVHAGWRLHFEHVRRSLTHGYYQGWDLNPRSCRRGTGRCTRTSWNTCPRRHRLNNFVEKAARATLVGALGGRGLRRCGDGRRDS